MVRNSVRWTAIVMAGAVLSVGGPMRSAFAAVRLVDVSGVDSGDCSSSPCATVNYAISQATAGDTISVGAGTYAEAVVVNKAVTITGAGVATTVFNGGGANPGTGSGEVLQYPPNPPAPALNVGFTIVASSVTISDLTVRNYGLHGIQGNAPQSNVTLTRLNASYNGWANNGGRGIFFGSEGSVAVDWTNVTISDSTARQNRLVGIDVNVGTNTGVTISGNTAIDNGDSGITLAGAANGSVSNNIVTNNGRFGIEIRNPSGPVTVDGNTVRASNDDTLAAPDRWPAAVAQLGWDLGGIVIYSRGVGEGQATSPTGVTVTNNSVAGYLQATSGAPGVGQGHGIVLEGTGHTVSGNSLFHNDVAIQLQSGQVSNTTSTDGFDRGNAATAVDATVSGNAICANRLAGLRVVGASATAPYPFGSNWWGTTAGPIGGASRTAAWVATGQIGPDNIVGSVTASAPLASAVGSIPASSDCRVAGNISVSLSGVAGAATVTATCPLLAPAVQNVSAPGVAVVVFSGLPAGTICAVSATTASGFTVSGPTSIAVPDNATGDAAFVLAAAPPASTTPPTTLAPTTTSNVGNGVPISGPPTTARPILPTTGSTPSGTLLAAAIALLLAGAGAGCAARRPIPVRNEPRRRRR
jgi:parallel beta-helix repeat protein